MSDIGYNNIYVLVGSIASGKTTWKKKFKELNPDTMVVSRDSIRYAFGDGDYLFDTNIESLVKLTCDDFFENLLLLHTENIIVDETNVSASGRERYFDIYNKLSDLIVTPNYIFNAVVFPDAGCSEHVRRRMLDNHGDTPRSTWEGVYRGLRDSYEPPTKGEGFDKIIYIGGEI